VSLDLFGQLVKSVELTPCRAEPLDKRVPVPNFEWLIRNAYSRARSLAPGWPPAPAAVDGIDAARRALDELMNWCHQLPPPSDPAVDTDGEAFAPEELTPALFTLQVQERLGRALIICSRPAEPTEAGAVAPSSLDGGGDEPDRVELGSDTTAAPPRELDTTRDRAPAVGWDGMSRDPNPQAPPRMTDRRKLILIEMLALGAVGRARKVTRDEVVKRINKRKAASDFARDFGALKQLGHTDSEAGPEGGIWLTPQGKTKASELNER
jgi:hypothetical protein